MPDDPSRTVLTDPIPERTTPVLELTLREYEDGPIVTDPESLTLTLFDVRRGTVINDRVQLNLMAYVSSGVLSFRMEAEDTVIVGSAAIEEHIALIEWTWNAEGSTGYGRHEVLHRIRNLHRVP